ncbi:XRE family transcriptional regulator [Alteromonas sp. 14N.309.X.WAT.G.H12]|uniref:helix-turn-helix domain-containing protein n=1 Tax=Alteromonas sp. 14N.309.X.WAT.G.H12 TaxID=3120824 RepID=UPI002FCEECD6
MSNNTQVGRQIANVLKKERHARGWSLDKTAQITGVSKAMLGQIERMESSPTIATLWKIATGLQCSFSSFITAQENNAVPVTLFADDDGFTEDPNVEVKTLFRYSPITKFETFEITIKSHHEQRSEPHQQGVLEHIHVIEGKVTVFEGDHAHIVAAGEQYIFHADKAHGYRDEAGKTRFLDIIFYP